MTDPRLTKMAQVLVHYSLALKEGELCSINTSPLAAPLVREIYREALLAGAHPLIRLNMEGLEELMLRHGSQAQLTHLPKFVEQEVEEIDARIAIMGSENTRVLSGSDPQKIALRRQAARHIMERSMQRSAEGTLKWCVALFPTNASAQDANMSLTSYEDFVYAACKVDQDDPIAAWKKLRADQQHIVDFLNTRKQIRLVSLDTDLTYNVAGRQWINCYGDNNFPDGEVFTGPEEYSAEGSIRYSFPAIYMGQEVNDIRLWFEKGKVVKATAAKGEELLHSLLDMDEGARFLGEVAFGTNYDIQHFSRNMLFDEKIGGTVHLALGAGYPESGSVNKSALHWDMLCDMRQGGEAYADGELFYKDGKFLAF